ncbi:MAG TPA: T9SS type A sorting domain-containing protein [Rubricoccaceae bacterium]|nr:T9SS type A sorting domain-containing protein [Rubricoccaceae bacterium]
MVARAQAPLLTLVSPDQGEGRFGSALTFAGDVSGDGRSDLLVGSYDEDPPGGPPSAGRAYVFDAATGGLLRSLASPNEQERGYFGVTVAGGTDADGDGRGDFAVAASDEYPGPGQHGRVYVFSGLVVANEEGPPVAGLWLAAAPSPFQTVTTLSLMLDQPAAVRLVVYDALGRAVAVLLTGEQPAGRREVVFDASSLPAGVYFARAEAGSSLVTRPLAVVR